MEIKELKYLIK